MRFMVEGFTSFLESYETARKAHFSGIQVVRKRHTMTHFSMTHHKRG
jgi:hypothetical protein